MDENYLDNLLNEISLDKELDYKIEDELDNQMKREKRLEQERNSISKEDMFDKDLENDANQIEDTFDLQFSEKQIEELDKLDDFADLDMSNIDFSDIDFNDVDVTRLDDVQADDLEGVLRDLEGDLTIDDFFDADTEKNLESEEKEAGLDSGNLEGFDENLNEETFNADDFLNSLLKETESSKVETVQDEYEAEKSSSSSVEENISRENNDGLDDLLSMLNLEEKSSDGADVVQEGIGLHDNADAIIEEADTGISGQSDKTKKSFMQILFGDPDEDDELSEEELKLIKEKKEAKKAEKEAAKQAKRESLAKERAKKNLEEKKKKQKNDEMKRLKAQKRNQEEHEKPLNKPMVAFVFSLFLGGVFLFYVFTNNVNYTQAIERAANFFAHQKYKSAYDEIVGIEVKKKDQELKERIYTVMYVERLYEAYENNVTLNREEKALDSLLRGVEKYYEHYEEAVELGIVDDIDNCFNQIQTELVERYGISVEEAQKLNKLENYQYVQSIDGYVAKVARTDKHIQ